MEVDDRAADAGQNRTTSTPGDTGQPMSLSAVGSATAVVLALLFVAAAGAKLRSPAATARSFAALGVPAATAMAYAVPAGEIAIAVALVLVPTIGSVAALTTLAFFTAFLVGRLRDGVRTPCACFGAVAAHPLAPTDLARNAGLLVLAALALAAPQPLESTVVAVLTVGGATLIAGLALHLSRPAGAGST
jgi:hypothetical protein